VVSSERHGHVATLWLDDPEARNAMGPAFFEQLPAEMGRLGQDDRVRAVVVAARGPHFSVGLDLGSLDSLAPPAGGSPAQRAQATYRQIKRLQASIGSVADCPKPVVAAVHGRCLGGGLDLAAACDMRVCSADAVFSLRETKMAMVADLGSLQRLCAVVGRGSLAELALTGKDVGAERAERIGLVNAVAPSPEAALEEARALAEEAAACSPLAVEGTKAVLAATQGRPLDEGLDYVALWNAAFLASHDLAEAVSAFFEKRPARFEGR
jgi:enoyl-CoA hydratase